MTIVLTMRVSMAMAVVMTVSMFMFMAVTVTSVTVSMAETTIKQRMAVFMPRTVGMPMTSMLKNKYSYKVYNESQYRNRKKSLMMHIRGLQCPLNTFRKYKECCEDEE